MVEVLLAALTLLAWWLFSRAVKRGRRVGLIVAKITADTRAFTEAMQRVGASANETAAAMRALSVAWANAAALDEERRRGKA